MNIKYHKDVLYEQGVSGQKKREKTQQQTSGKKRQSTFPFDLANHMYFKNSINTHIQQTLNSQIAKELSLMYECMS